MSRVLPILFNTEMVQAILDGRKTVTRRVVKVPPYYPYFYKLHDNSDGALTGTKNRLFAGFYDEDKIFHIDGEKHIDAVYYQAPYQPGNILYVRETWTNDKLIFGDGVASVYRYKADEEEYLDANGEHIDVLWYPSIHMPKKAARIWLKVTNVRVERLQEIKPEDAVREGTKETFPPLAVDEFWDIWNSTIKKTDLDRYGWNANPWVWVIEFVRCEKPEN